MKFKQQFHKLYAQLSPQAQSLLAYAYASIPMPLRKKRGFWGFLDFLRKSQWESIQWHEDYQLAKLQALIASAGKTSAYYRNLFKANGINTADINSPADLKHIPILQKETLIHRLDEFIPENFPRRRLMINSTSGSTGEPFKFYEDYYAVMREEAFAVRHWENAGMKLGEPAIYLRSYVPNNQNATYRYDPVNNRHYLSAYHLDEQNLHFYCKKIEQIGSKFIFGYPSSLEVFADFLSMAGKTLKFSAVITGSEMLTPNARGKMERSFGAKVFDWYGLAEPTVTMGQCELGGYHLFSEYGYLELLNAQNNLITTEGEIGRIVGTNFTNQALPIIRYDTGDLGVHTNQKCNCGRGTPAVISAIHGRKDDLLVGANGQFLPSVNFYSMFAKLGGEVHRFQLIQNGRSKFCLKLIRGPEFDQKSISTIVEGLNQRIGGRPEIEIEAVAKITPTRAGKIRAVIRNFSLSASPNGEEIEN